MNNNPLVDWLNHHLIFGLPPEDVALAVVAALAAFLVMSTALRIVLSRLSKLAARTTTHADDMLVEVLSGTKRWVIALVSVLIGLGTLDLSDRWGTRVGQFWFVVLTLQLALWANRAVAIGLRGYRRRHAVIQDGPASAAETLMSWGVRCVLWSMALLAMLSNVGINVTAFIASLGVGGIAIALALQNVLGDLFGSVAIALDKPFEVGDFIVFGSIAGSVEAVGIKTTRIRSLGGEQIVMANTELLKQTISNYKRLRERRIVFGFGVTYDTTADQMAGIPAVVKRVVTASSGVRFDRAHFKAFGDSSLDFEVVYIVLNPDYNIYMDEQQRINIALMRELEARGIGFAFPTRTVHLVQPPRAQAMVAAA
jgi:small-conductance mechanosensitive channel